LLVAVIATLINIYELLPLFGTFFIHDDFEILRQGPHLRTDPFSIFTFHYKSFWRPLGFGLTGIIYLFAGLNTLPYHVIGYLVHLATAFAVLLLGKRLHSTMVGLVAYILYILSPVSFCAPGFISSAFQDELASGFLVLALAWGLRSRSGLEKCPYWGSAIALFGASLCKESWLFFLPALIAVDWANYPKSKLRDRICRLFPLLPVFAMLLLRILIVGYSQIVEVTSYDLSCFLYPQNLYLGLVQTFFPLDITVAQGWEYIVQIVLTVGFLTIPWLIMKDKRKLLTIYLALGFLWFITAISAQMNGFRGWIHLQSVAAFTGIIVGIGITAIIAIKPKLFCWSAFFVLLIGLNLWGARQILALVDVTKEKSEYYRVTFDTFKALISRLPEGSHIYMLGGLAPELVEDSFLPRGMKYTQVLILRPDEDRIATEGTLAGDPGFLMDKLGLIIGRPETHIIQRLHGGGCTDITEAIITATQEGKPLPIYLGKD